MAFTLMQGLLVHFTAEVSGNSLSATTGHLDRFLPDVDLYRVSTALFQCELANAHHSSYRWFRR